MGEVPFIPMPSRFALCRGWLVVLCVTFAAQVWTLTRVEGYGLADSVEYMDRAWDVARGAGLGPESPRSFAFSGLLLPFFFTAELLDLHDLRGVVLGIRFMQMALGLLAVAVVLRIGGRLFGGPTGKATGLLLGLNPVFLLHSIEPLSGTAAALFLALGLEALFPVPSPPLGRGRDDRSAESERARGQSMRGLLGGTWLGLGVMMAYQTLPLAATVLIVGFASNRGRRGAPWAAAWVAFTGWLLVQAFLDLAVFGSFGSTLGPYIGANVGGILTRILAELHLDGAARWIYVHVVAPSVAADLEAGELSSLRSLQPPDWYLVNLTSQALPWPALVLVLGGVVAFALRPRRAVLAVVMVVVVNVALMSFKGAKSFRLWLPLLPFVAILGGAGFALLSARGSLLARATAWIVLIAGCFGGLAIVGRTNLAANGGYWRALEALNDLADGATRPIRVTSTYYWAVLFRSVRGVELEKLPHHLDRWGHLDLAQREEVLGALGGVDAFVTHLSVLEQDARLAQVVGRELRLAEVFLDPKSGGELGPIGLFTRPRPDLPVEGRALFETEELPPGGVDVYQERVQRPARVVFAREAIDGQGDASFVFLGWDVAFDLAGGAGLWVTYHWLAEAVDGRDYLVRDRITDNLAREAWNHVPRAHGTWPTSRWKAGQVVRESYFVPIPREVRRFGGPYGRGELYPAELYLSVAQHTPDGSAGAQLPVLRSFERSPLSPPAGERQAREPFRALGVAGTRWNRDGQILVGTAWVPVSKPVLFPDEGEP